MTTNRNNPSPGAAPVPIKDAQAVKVDSLIKSVLVMSRKTIHSARRPAGYFPEIRSKVTKLTPS